MGKKAVKKACGTGTRNNSDSPKRWRAGLWRGRRGIKLGIGDINSNVIV